MDIGSPRAIGGLTADSIEPIGANGVDVDGVTLKDGNVVLGNGNGIDFSATSDGSGTATTEILDDYERGNFTPVIADAATDGNSASLSQATGRYVKVGKSVTVVITIINVTTTGLTAGNTVYLRGLPYAAPSLTNVRCPFATTFDEVKPGSLNLMARVIDNTTYCTFRGVDATTGAGRNLIVSDINSPNAYSYVAGTYEDA